MAELLQQPERDALTDGPVFDDQNRPVWYRECAGAIGLQVRMRGGTIHSSVCIADDERAPERAALARVLSTPI